MVAVRLRYMVGVVALLLAAGHVQAQVDGGRASQGGRLVHDTVTSAALAGNHAGDTPVREVLVYLPPGYDDGARRYPVLYLLHGQTSTPVEWVDGTYYGFRLPATMDSLAALRAGEFIVVMPNADNEYGGSFYVSSRWFGGWETFIAEELVRHVDARYRTQARRESRGLAGFSLGGFGALHIGARHPQTFAFVYAMSPCCTGFIGEMAPTSELWMQASTQATSFTGTPGALRRAWMQSAAFALPTDREPLRQLPYAAPLNAAPAAVPGVVERWRELLPLERVVRDTAAYRALSGLVLEYGVNDQIASVSEGTRALSARLAELGVPHVLEAHDGDHVGSVHVRLQRHLLPYFGRMLR